MKLRFGKFKGELLESTPQWYQQWLTRQDWFKPFDEYALGLSSLHSNLISKKKAYGRGSYIYISEGLYLTPDGDMVELD